MTTGEWVRSQWQVFSAPLSAVTEVSEWASESRSSCSCHSSVGESLSSAPPHCHPPDHRCVHLLWSKGPPHHHCKYLDYFCCCKFDINALLSRPSTFRCLARNAIGHSFSLGPCVNRKKTVCFRKGHRWNVQLCKTNQSMRRQVFNYISYVMVCMALIEHHVVDII